MLIDWFTVGAQALNFLILVWLLKHFLYKPILDGIDAREKRITTEIANANATKAEAQKEQQEFQHKNEEFEQERAALLSRATEEAKAERQRLLDEARQAADALHDKRQESLRREQEALNDAIIRCTREEVFAITRKTLADLASATLEASMSGMFTRRLRGLEGEAKANLGAALAASSEPAVVCSAFDLPSEQRDAIHRALNETFSADIPVRFETKPDVISGIELTANGRRVAWSIADYLASLEKNVAALLTADPKSQAKPEANPDTSTNALSGGVDSTVAAVLVHRAMGDRLTNIFVDTGMLRKNEFADTLDMLRNRLGLRVIGVDASDRFLGQLAGVTDPEQKRKIIGREFIAVFAQEAQKLQTGDVHGQIEWLVQGTLYPDVIESVSVKGPSATIKSHHNVGGLPKNMPFALIEPLRDLFKDEVRRIGKNLGLPEEILLKHPFPGPGLAVRLLGEITRENLHTLQEADAIVVEEIRLAGLYNKVWQAFAVLLPIRSVGVMGDFRTYGLTIAVRVVESEDAMTADWVRLPGEVLERISTRIVNEVRGVTRVVYDISSKPPSTIEWE